MSTQWKTGSGSFNGLSVESAQFILDIGKFCNWISFFLADGQHLSFWHTCFWLFEFKISDIWQQLSYRTKLRTTGLMALPFTYLYTSLFKTKHHPLFYPHYSCTRIYFFKSAKKFFANLWLTFHSWSPQNSNWTKSLRDGLPRLWRSFSFPK